MSVFNAGPLATLLSRLSATKSGYLDAAISSRAASATALSTAQWTNARATKLDNLDVAVSSVGNTPPASLNGYAYSYADIRTGVESENHLTSFTASTSTFNTWTSVKTVSAAGWMHYLSFFQNANASSLEAAMRLKIDGTVVLTTDTDAWQSSADNGKGYRIIGNGTESDQLFAPIYFSTSFTVEMLKSENNAGSITMGCKVLWSTE